MDIVEEFLELTRAVTRLQIDPHISTLHTCQEKSSHIFDGKDFRHESNIRMVLSIRVHAHVGIPGECGHFGAAILRVAFPDTWTTSTDACLNFVTGAWVVQPPTSCLSLLWFLKRPWL